MKKNAIKNALRVLVAICAAIATMFTTSCSEMFKDIEEIEPKIVEVPVELESEHTNWINDSLYVGTSASSRWMLFADIDVETPAILLDASKQGKPSFSGAITGSFKKGNDITVYNYVATSSLDGQKLTGQIQIRQDAFVELSNVKVTVQQIDAVPCRLGTAKGMKVTVWNQIVADVTLANGNKETVRHNIKNTYLQCEEVVRTETVEKVITEYVEVHDTITNEIVKVDTLIRVDSVTVYIYEQVHDTTVVYRDVEKWMHDTTYVVVHDTIDRVVVVPEYHETIVEVHDTINQVVIVPEYHETIVEVHDTTMVTVHDTVFVEVTIIEPQIIEVHDTIIVNKYIYLKNERIETKDRLGYSLANVKVGNENILSATLNLAQRVVTVPEEKLNTAVLTNYSDAGCSMDDGQSGVLTISANGCTVNRIAWADPVYFDTDSYGTLFDVACTLYCSRVNEIGETVNFEVELIPSYYHVAATPEPEPAVTTYSVGFSNEAPSNSKMSGTFFVSGTDGFSDEYTMPVAVYGLPQGIETLYVKDMTQFGHTAESEETAGSLKAKGNWNWCYDVTYTTIETQFKTVNDGLVGPYNRLTYKVAHVERELPNGETVVWKIKATTVVDDDEYVTDNTKSDHFCEEEQHDAHYEQTLRQHVTHYISGTVKIGDGEPMEIIFTDLQKVGDKYLLDEGTAVTNIYSTGGN